MTRLFTALLTILIALMVVSPVFASGNGIMVTGHVLDFDAESNTFIAIISIDGEMMKGITITAENQLSEDVLTSGDTDTFSGTIDNGILIVNGNTLLYTTINHPVTITDNAINGVSVQFNGSVQNGYANLIRNADAYSTNGLGYIIQDNTVITFAAFSQETQHTVFLPVVMN